VSSVASYLLVFIALFAVGASAAMILYKSTPANLSGVHLGGALRYFTSYDPSTGSTYIVLANQGGYEAAATVLLVDGSGRVSTGCDGSIAYSGGPAGPLTALDSLSKVVVRPGESVVITCRGQYTARVSEYGAEGQQGYAYASIGAIPGAGQGQAYGFGSGISGGSGAWGGNPPQPPGPPSSYSPGPSFPSGPGYEGCSQQPAGDFRVSRGTHYVSYTFQSVSDPWARYAGYTLDSCLRNDFWATGQANLGVIGGYASGGFYINLQPGVHYLTIRISAGGPQYVWNVCITIAGQTACKYTEYGVAIFKITAT